MPTLLYLCLSSAEMLTGVSLHCSSSHRSSFAAMLSALSLLLLDSTLAPV